MGDATLIDKDLEIKNHLCVVMEMYIKKSKDTSNEKEHAKRLVDIAYECAKGDAEVAKRLVRNVTTIMNEPCGKFMHTTILKIMLHSDKNAKAIFLEPFEDLKKSVVGSSGNRKKSMSHIYKALKEAKTELTKVHPDIANCPIDTIAEKIERSAYNCIVTQCDSYTVMCSWDNPEFISYYRERISIIYEALNPHSKISKSIGLTFPLRVIKGEIDPVSIGEMTTRQIHPEGFSVEMDIINLRREQKVEETISELFKCPVCKARRCTYKEVQVRSADEPGSITCKCLNCGARFEPS